MRKLLLRIFCLVGPVLLLGFAVLFLPPTPRIKKSLLFSLLDKNKLLKNIPNPRLILIGGSNLSLGIDSKQILDSLKINPINMGIHANIGLKYMLASCKNYIRKGDIVIIVPEYQQFYGGYANGKIELLSVIVDVAPETIDLLDYKQFFNLVKYVPEYSISKVKSSIFGDSIDNGIGVYDRKSFNAYGDAYIHWKLSKRKVAPYPELKGDVDDEAFAVLINFKNAIYTKGARLYVAFPCFQDLSFNKSKRQIKQVEKRLKENGFILLGTPERYKMNDSLIFNTPYHLTKAGVDYRTSLLIEDLRQMMNANDSISN